MLSNFHKVHKIALQSDTSATEVPLPSGLLLEKRRRLGNRRRCQGPDTDHLEAGKIQV